MKKATKIPSGCIETLVEKSPVDKAPTDLDIPHAGHGTPVKSLKGHKVGSEVKLPVPRYTKLIASAVEISIRIR